VAGSVQGLKPQNLTMVDVNGNTLTPDDGVGSTAGLSSKQLDSQRGYEAATEHNLQAMLDNVLGPGKATVRVSAVMNWDQIEQTNETYTPGDPTQTPVLTNHTITESSNGGAAAGGIPGAASNNAAVPTYQGGNGSSGTTSKTDTETTYQLNKSVQKTVRAPGALTRLSVSVMLDDDPNNPNTALVQNVQNAVNAAAGIDPSRGDMLTVTSLPFNRQELVTAQAEMEQAAQKQQLMDYLHLGALAVGPLLMLVVLFFLLRGRKRQTNGNTAADIQAQASAPRVVEVVEKSAPAMVVPGRTNKPSTVAQPITEDPQKLYIREQIQMLGKSNPATVAQLIQTWMDEDRRN
jgi:flagellar M-ring protein FliF